MLSVVRCGQAGHQPQALEKISQKYLEEQQARPKSPGALFGATARSLMSHKSAGCPHAPHAPRKLRRHPIQADPNRPA